MFDGRLHTIMFSRSYKQIPSGPSTPQTPVKMTLLPDPASADATPKIGWSPPAARLRGEYLEQDENYKERRRSVPIVLEYSQQDVVRSRLLLDAACANEHGLINIHRLAR